LPESSLVFASAAARNNDHRTHVSCNAWRIYSTSSSFKWRARAGRAESSLWCV
jgi:hypothetical protein